MIEKSQGGLYGHAVVHWSSLLSLDSIYSQEHLHIIDVISQNHRRYVLYIKSRLCIYITNVDPFI